MGHGRLHGCTKTGSPRLGRMLAWVCCGVVLAASGIASGAVWTANGPNGGRVNAIAVDPSTPTTVYAGTDSGGFFKSLDSGTTWTPISAGVDALASPTMTGIAVDPATPARVYATASLGLAEYCIGFGGAAGGQIADKGATSFKVTKPTAQVRSSQGD